MNPLKAGLIGAGHISGHYLQAARYFQQQFEVVVCADLDPAAAKARAREFGIASASIEELLNDESIGLVINLTIPKAHVPVGLRAIGPTSTPIARSHWDYLSLRRSLSCSRRARAE